ncbi:MAG TPA: TIGR01458 family HAD-type hydrolase [Acidimicrobiales bacterium]|nr:TIGR01458 family HAD-type hydrolase [Acidimicrobiales bacterium]
MTVDGLLVDIDGVLTVSWEPIPGAAAAHRRLREAGVPMRYATNTTSRSRAAVAEALRAAGFEVDAHEIVNAPAATAALLRRDHPGARCLLVTEGDPTDDLEGVTLVDEPPIDVVVLGGAGPAYTHEALTRAFRALLDGAALVAMHRNSWWRTADGLTLDTGAYLVGLEAAAGVTAEVAGKPAPAFLAAGLDALGLPAERVAMVGDDVESDVLGAQANGLTGVLVRTGKFRPDDLAHLDGSPDVVLDGFADVPAWLGR